MTAETNNACAHAHAESILRSLAVRALGVSGADIERLIREARQRARRDRRPLSFNDIDEAIDATRPYVSEEQLWRRAVHEAGHVIARVKLGIGRIKVATINGPFGQSYVEHEVGLHELQTEADLTAAIVIILAGRAAEEEILGRVTAGAGGSAQSDLALATELAFDMEGRFGFGGHWPLLYRGQQNALSPTDHDKLLHQANLRLEAAYDDARRLIRGSADAVRKFAAALLLHSTLEAAALNSLIDEIIFLPQAAINSSVSNRPEIQAK